LVWEGHWQEVWGTEVTQRGPGQNLGGVWGRKLRHEAEKKLLKKKTNQVHTSTSYDNIIVNTNNFWL